MRFLRILFLLPFLLYAVPISQQQALPAPAWVQEGVVYSIFLRNFSSTGDFKGAIEKLDDLKELGVTIAWLLPIHPIGKEHRKGSLGSPYSVQDYYAINPAYGTKADFKAFVTKAHQLGIKVIFDAVLNHTSWDNGLMKQPNFYLRDSQNQVLPPQPDWSDVAALDYKNPKVRTYLIDVLKYWLKEFDLDGFRMDAASLVPLDFWEQARKSLQAVKADLLFLGEEDMPEALVSAFNLDYAWKFEGALNEVMTNGAPATSTLKASLELEKTTFPRGALHLRFSDNHDKKRALVRFGEKGSLAASALIFTLNGVPLIPNGMEVGDPSETYDPAMFERIPIFWKSAEIRPEFLRFYKEIIALRRTHPALRTGELVWLNNSDDSRIVTYLRKTAEEEFFIAINLSNRPFQGTVERFSTLSLNAWEFRISPIKF